MTTQELSRGAVLLWGIKTNASFDPEPFSEAHERVVLFQLRNHVFHTETISKGVRSVLPSCERLHKTDVPVPSRPHLLQT